MKFLWNLHPDDELLPMAFGDDFKKANEQWNKVCDDATIEKAYFLYSIHWASEGYWIEFKDLKVFVGTIIRSKEVFHYKDFAYVLYKDFESPHFL